MRRCLDLAQKGLGNTYPNPMVGCVIVCDGRIIGEGWHKKAGEAHAEVNAIQSVENKEWLKNSKLYVSLEPCAHFGKTPPCSDLIVAHQISEVVIGTGDPFAQVNGMGIRKLEKAGIKVKLGVLEKECRELNKRFFHFHQHKKPFVILKWAQTADGYMATETGEQKWITNSFSKQLVHKWRTEERSILVGYKTAKFDNPQLNARLWAGNQPLRLVIDRDLSLDADLNLFDQSQKTLVFTEKQQESQMNLNYFQMQFDENLEENILHQLYEMEIQSVLIEGGVQTLNRFISKGLWDEARILTASQSWGSGVKSPKMEGEWIEYQELANDNLKIFKR